MVSGFHGNNDPMMIFFVLLSVYLIEKGERLWLAGVVLGLALNVKVAPLIFAPAIFFYLSGTRRRIEFFGTAAATFFVGSLPYLVMDSVVVKNVFGYSSLYGQWGWTAMLKRWYWEAPRYLNPPYNVIGIHATFAAVGKWVMLATIVAASFWINRRRRVKPPLMLQCGLVVTLFLFLTSGFGIQYLAWLVPWVIALDLWPIIVWYTAAGLYQLTGYTCWAYRTLSPAYCEDDFFYITLLCWCSLIVLLLAYRHQIARDKLIAADSF
jgi:hypothetical protein